VRQAEDNIEQASGCLSDFAGVGVCGVKPFNSGKNKSADDPAAPGVFGSCGAQFHDMATSIHPIAEPEESKSVLRRLLEAQVGRQDPVGLILRVEPSGSKLFVTDKERAKSVGWLASSRLLGGRAVRCLRVDADEHYPSMRSFNYEVDDNMSEPILGYYCPVVAGPYDVPRAQQRRAEMKKVLDFIHEGVKTGENVIIHCRLGTNRSVMVAVAYLMIYQHLRAQDAIELVQRRGPSRLVVRQPGFTKQLLRLEQELLQRRASVDVNSWRDMANEWANTNFGNRDQDLRDLGQECCFLQDKLMSQAGVTQRVLAAAHNAASPGSPGFPALPLHVLSHPNTPGKHLAAVATAKNHAATGAMWAGPDGDSAGTRATEAVAPAGAQVGEPARTPPAGALTTCASASALIGPLTPRAPGGGEGGGGVEGGASVECVSAVVDVLQNQIWNAKVLVLERQDKNVYVLALASPDQVPLLDLPSLGVVYSIFFPFVFFMCVCVYVFMYIYMYTYIYVYV